MFIRLEWVSMKFHCDGKNRRWRAGLTLTLGCRLYFLFALGATPVIGVSPCLTLCSVVESSLRYEPSTLPACSSAMGNGRNEDWPRDSAIAR
jgi:hypothetical protein